MSHCPACPGNGRRLFQTKDYNRSISEIRFTYFRCIGCGLVYLGDIPSNLGDYYQSEYYAIPANLEQLALEAEPERWKLETVQKLVPGGRLLEIGPSHGRFSYLAKQAGFQVEVIERDAECCRFLNETVGVHAINTTEVSSLPVSEPIYDVIAMWHVIEHVPEPWETFKAIARALKPGGIFVVASPNPESLQLRLLRRYWTHIDAPRHLHLMPVSLLERWAAPLGLKLELATTEDAGGRLANTTGWQASLGNWSRKPKSRLTLQRLGKVLTKVCAPLEKGTRGSAYTVVFRRVE